MTMRTFPLLCCLLSFACSAPLVSAQSSSAPAAETTSGSATTPSVKAADEATAVRNTQAVAAQETQKVGPRRPDFLEHLVDEVLGVFHVRGGENTLVHFSIALAFLTIALLMRRVFTRWIFNVLRRIASRTRTTLDDKLLPALEAPVSTYIALVGIFAALAVVKLPPASDVAIDYGSTVAFSIVIFWGLLRAFGALLDHAQEIARHRELSVAAFMPWIKKTLVTLFVILGVLMVVQSLGYNVRALLAGLGIGGLAFALAAQDTLANVFGSVVVAIDQPFKIGEFVKIGGVMGGVEDIGLRSTKLRAVDKSLIIIPNKTVAAETITNLGRFTQRRTEQVIGLTYSSRPEQMAEIVEEFKRLILKEDYVDPTSVMVFFRDFSASSLDIWVVYVTKDNDFQKHMRLRQKLNTEFMQAVAARGLSFAFPTQTVHLEGEIAQQLADARLQPSADRPPPPGPQTV